MMSVLGTAASEPDDHLGILVAKWTRVSQVLLVRRLIVRMTRQGKGRKAMDVFVREALQIARLHFPCPCAERVDCRRKPLPRLY